MKMNEKTMFAYLIHLSANMWGDPDSSKRTRFAPYYPELPTSDEVWKTTVDFLPSQGFNTLLIDRAPGRRTSSKQNSTVFARSESRRCLS